MTRPATEIERFYRARADRLLRIVAAQVHTTDVTVLEDACQFAWLALLCRPDVTLNDRGAAWLATTAIRHGWKLARVPREVPSGAFRGDDAEDPLEHPEPAALDGDPEARALARSEHDARADAFATLPADQRRELLLKAAGYSYRESAELSRSTAGQISRRLVAGRRRLGQLEELRAARDQRARRD